MPRMRLTEDSVLALKCRPKAYRVQDSGTGCVRGLHVLVQPTGTRTYRVDYQGGSMSLGRVEEMTLEEARTKAIEILRMARRGEDPRSGGGPATFEELVARWSQHKLDAKGCVPASVKHVEQFMLSSCEGWRTLKPAEITRRHVDTVLDTKLTNAKSAANLLHKCLKALFRWAHSKEWIPDNPTAKVAKPWQVAEKATRRKRAWFKGEQADTLIKALWRYADDLHTEPNGLRWSRFIKLMIITGKRCNAVEDMKWEHISQAWYWTPPSRSPTKRNNPIPLPKLARRLLTPRGLIGKVMVRVSHRHLMACARLRAGVPEDFIWHGLRHVMITKLRELRVPHDIARLITDHTDEDDDVHSGYEHHDPTKEMSEALERWCDYIEALVTPAEGVAVLR